MGDILASAKAKQDRPQLVRFFQFVQDPDMIADMRKKLEDAIGLFTVCGSV